MRGQQWRLMVSAAALAVTLSGCVQATRHSNAIVFGTNTSLGIKVGPDATTTPGISIGYSRQEAVFMPLLANTAETAERVEAQRRQLGALQPSLSPCNIDPTHVARVAAGQEGRPMHAPLSADEIRRFSESQSANPCLFVGRRSEGSNQMATDSYSVFASFGGHVSGGQGTPPSAALGVGQYFATGVAAQILAANGGARISSIATPAPPERRDAQNTNPGANNASNTGNSTTTIPNLPALPPFPSP